MMALEKRIVASEEVDRCCLLEYLSNVSRSTDTQGATHIPRVLTGKLRWHSLASSAVALDCLPPGRARSSATWRCRLLMT